MNLDCPHLLLAPYWADEDDDRRIVLVRSMDALGLCRDGAYEAVSAAQTCWTFDDESERLRWRLPGFALDAGLTSPFRALFDQWELVALVRAHIRRGELVGLRESRMVAASEADPTTAQRRLVRDIQSQSRGPLVEGGRRYLLIPGADLAGTIDRNSYEVVSRDEARRVLAAMAKESGGQSGLAALLAKASDTLSSDWRPPLSANGLVLLRRIQAPRAAVRSQEPAVTPSQLRRTKEGWITIEVRDDRERPWQGELRLVLADGSSRDVSTNEEGVVYIENIEPGQVETVIANLDAGAWQMG